MNIVLLLGADPFDVKFDIGACYVQHICTWKYLF